MTKKISFKELAEFIADDVTISIFPDIVWPTECRLRKDKINWLTERLDTLYNRYLENPNEPITDTESTYGADQEEE